MAAAAVTILFFVWLGAMLVLLIIGFFIRDPAIIERGSEAVVRMVGDNATVSPKDIEEYPDPHDGSANDRYRWLAEMNYYGSLLEKKGRTDQAIEIYEELVDTDGDTSHTYDRLAIIYRRRKELSNEIRILEAAAENVQDDTKRLRYLEQLEKAAGKTDPPVAEK